MVQKNRLSNTTTNQVIPEPFKNDFLYTKKKKKKLVDQSGLLTPCNRFVRLEEKKIWKNEGLEGAVGFDLVRQLGIWSIGLDAF